jgi:hypothetical protein
MEFSRNKKLKIFLPLIVTFNKRVITSYSVINNNLKLLKTARHLVLNFKTTPSGGPLSRMPDGNAWRTSMITTIFIVSSTSSVSILQHCFIYSIYWHKNSEEVY